MHSDNILVETYTSTKDARTKNNNKIIEINVCLIISNFIFSLLLSFIIDLYNFIQLTVIQTITGIKIRFCKKTVLNKNVNPFCTPRTPQYGRNSISQTKTSK